MGKVIAAVIAAVVITVGIIFGVTHKSNTGSNSNNSSPPASNASNNSSPQSNGNASQPAATINIVNMLFTPSQVTINKGQTVKWTNNDSVTHTVVDDLSNVGGPNSGGIAPGSSYSFTFNKTGSFQYHCSIHPSMRGTIVVK